MRKRMRGVPEAGETMDGWREYLREVQAQLEELRAMGITDLVLPAEAPRAPAPAARAAQPPPARSAAPLPPAHAPRATPPPVGPQASLPPPAAAAAERGAVVAASAGDRAAALAAEKAALQACRRCKLCESRKTIVYGVGSPHADVMFVGEGPGEDEDRTGEPFVGKAGQLLTKIIEAMGLTREQVYIANVVKCRPPNNRTPMLDETEQCYPFLRRQIEIVRPRIIVSLGLSASQTLLQVTIPIGKLRGNFYKFGEARVMPTFHPAYLLRTPGDKKLVWDDMKKVMAELGLQAPRGDK
jgi:DNA polymerase